MKLLFGHSSVTGSRPSFLDQERVRVHFFRGNGPRGVRELVCAASTGKCASGTHMGGPNGAGTSLAAGW